MENNKPFNKEGEGRGSRRPDRAARAEISSYKEKMLDLRRVTRVMAGGKRFKFRATVVIGDERGQVGIGVGKGVDVQQSVAKAKSAAHKNMVNIPLYQARTIAHEVSAKYSAAKVLLKPAAAGHGLRAGGSVRFVLAMAGVKDATAKILSRTPNKLTNAMAAIEALRSLKSKKPTSSTSTAATAK